MTTDEVMHQGKTISQWEKAFNGEFTYDQILKMARGGADLEKILMLGLDETEVEDAALSEPVLESISPKYIVNVKVMGMNVTFTSAAESEEDAKTDIEEKIKKLTNGSKAKIESIEKIKTSLNESSVDSIVTVSDFLDAISRAQASKNDKIMFRYLKDKQACEVFDMHGKGGTFVIDLVPVIANSQLNEAVPLDDDSNIDSEQWQQVRDWLVSNGYDVKPTKTGGFVVTDPVVGMKFFSGKDGFEMFMQLKDKNLAEGRDWRNGGYGGYGRSYKSYGELDAPRGKAISWFSVDKLDPKAKGKMLDWRIGPSNFKFNDLLYPERDYKVGTTVLRSKFLKAGDESGVKYIAVPSYIDAIKNKDEEAIALLTSLSIPLDLTFGYGPDEDFSSTYTVKDVQ